MRKQVNQEQAGLFDGRWLGIARHRLERVGLRTECDEDRCYSKPRERSSPEPKRERSSPGVTLSVMRNQ